VAVVDSWGRRPLLLWGVAGIVVALLALGSSTSGILPFGPEADAWTSLVALLLYVGCYQASRESFFLFSQKNKFHHPVCCSFLLLSFFFLSSFLSSSSGFSNTYNLYILKYYKMQVSFGPISWLLCGEVFPLKVRGQAIALATLTNFASNFVVSLALPPVQQAVGPAGEFLGCLGFIYR
jgi:MFS family permease